MTRLNQSRFLFLVSAWMLLLPLQVQASLPSVQCRPVNTSSSYSKATYPQAKVRIGEYIDLLKDLRREIDSSQFDQAALVDRLDYDASRIITFVKQEIAYQAYDGALRGVSGSLMGGSGNALDQSMLLASLLKDAGHEARIVRAKLSEAQAMKLLTQIAPAKIKETAWKSKKAAQDLMMKLAMSAGASQKDSSTLLTQLSKLEKQNYPKYAIAEQTFQALLPTLKKAGSFGANEPLPKEILSQAQDYFWVQSRLSPSEAWSDTHPVFEEKSPFAKLTPQSYYTETIPAELHHKFRLDFMIEQKIGNTLKVHKIMKSIEGPALNLIGNPLTYMNVPDKLATSGLHVDPKKAITESNSYFPVFNNDIAPSAMAFSLQGNVVPADVQASSMAGVFKEVAEKTGKAANAIAVLGESSKLHSNKTASLMMLTAQFFEITLTAPGGKEKKIRRYLVDRLTDKGRSENKAMVNTEISDDQVRQLLAQQITIMPAVGQFNSAYILDKILEKSINSQALYEVYAAKILEPNKKHRFSESDLKSVDARWYGHFPMYYAFDEIQRQHPETAIYRSEPTVVSIAASFPGAERAFQQTDILFHSRTALNVHDGKVGANKTLIAKSGVWDSFAEGYGLDSNESTSSAEKLSAAANLHLISKVEALKNISDIELKKNTSKAIVQGYKVALSSEKNSTDWWRVHSETGEVLAMSRDGRGQDATAKVMLIISISMALMFALIGYFSCSALQGAAGKNGGLCCLKDAISYGGGGFIIGLAAGVFVEAVTAMMFFDIAGGYTMMGLGAGGLLPSFC